MDQEEKIQTEYDEIDLMDYVKVLLKRKLLIFGIFLAAAIAAGVFSFISPKVYKIDTTLEIGKIDNELLEGPPQLIEEIKGDVYKSFIQEKLNLSEEKYPQIKAENPKDTNLIKIEIESERPELAKNILSEISNLILKEHQEQFDQRRSKIEENIKEIKNELTLLEKQKVYSDEGISQLQITILNLKEKINNAEPTKIIKPPTTSPDLIRPKPVLNIVIAGILGIFIGTFLAFFQEWWEKNKIKLKRT
jgi:capsular polysaccharide biosynthesis protein